MLYGLMVTYMRPQVACATLAALNAQTRTIDSLIVVDNGSQVPLPNGDYTVLQMGENVGPAGGIAAGIRYILERAADEDWILVIDDDDPPATHDLIERLLSFAESVKTPDLGGVGAVGARFDSARSRIRRVADDELGSYAIEVDYFGGGQCPIYRVAALRLSGGPSPELFFGFDDLELGLRLRAVGFRLLSNGPIHEELRTLAGSLGVDPSASRARLSEPTWRTYYSRRNFLVILRTYGGCLPAIGYTVLICGKLIINVFSDWRLALRVTKITLRALSDGWRGRMGRTVEPGLGVIEGGPS